jgi:hypothetical protein
MKENRLDFCNRGYSSRRWPERSCLSRFRCRSTSIDISTVAAEASVHSVRDRVAALIKAGTRQEFSKKNSEFREIRAPPTVVIFMQHNHLVRCGLFWKSVDTVR